MVRTMMDEGGGGGAAGAGGPQTAGGAADVVEEEKGVAQPGGQLVQGGRASTYVGATHFMAILEDVSLLFSSCPHWFFQGGKEI